ncbi:MAG TPA: ABC transporter ATP-binding protein [Blastocatellia bacterium]|nr:ABC transporter ATP-binding protein [Blastocatellia bacterium]
MSDNATSEPMIKLENVTKYYKTFPAVNHISFEIGKGEVFGFIGPNGAGKTTSIKMLATLMLPSEGRLTIGGYDVVTEPYEVRRIIGYMPDSFGVYEDLLAWEYLDYFAALYHLNPAQRKRAIDDVLELTDLTVKRDAQVMSLSRGMKQRLCLAKTLLHDPSVLLLDEPASGLDPHARIEIRELIRELCRMGKTVLVSSHILTELADFCTSIGIIEAGRVLAAGRIDEITAQLAGNVMIEITVKGDAALALSVLSERPEVKRTTCDGRTIHAEYTGQPDEVDDLLEYLIARGVRVLRFGVTEANLEDIFLKVTRGVVA